MMDLAALSGRDLVEYRDARRPKLNDTSLQNELGTVRNWLEYGVALESVEPSLVDALGHLIPSLTSGDDASDVLIDPDRCRSILQWLSRYEYASRDHVTLQLLWDTGCRLSGLRSLDTGDVDPEARTVTFRDRRDTGTPLKNGQKSERKVVVASETAEVIDAYVRDRRTRRTDDWDREPLVSTPQGRAADSTVRRTAYRLTQPCLLGGCPHGRDTSDCEALEHGRESKCPSSLSPHPIRTGRITDLRNRGVPVRAVSGRVDAIPETIRRYYDHPDLDEDLARRRDIFESTGL